MTRLAPLTLVVALVFSGGACAKAKAGSGAGEDVSLCTAYKLYDDVEEPSPEDPAAVRDYAQTVVRIYDRVDSHLKVNDHEIPRAVMTNVKQIMTSMRRFDRAYAHATSRDERRAAEADLVADRKLDRAINAITAFTKDQCVKKTNVPQITTPPTTK